MGEKRRNIQKMLRAGNDRCPLCWATLSESHITFEHVPPRSFGGIKACLTCRNCNNAYSKDEEFMRRDVAGMARAWMLDSNRRKVAAADASWKRWTDSEIDQIHRLHGKAAAEDAAATEGFISFETEHGLWPSKGAVTPPNLYRIDSMEFQFPSDGQVTRAWIKSLYLLAGCARRGEAWVTAWAPQVREYLQGKRPWGDDIGDFDGNFDTPWKCFVARCQVGQRSDVFVSAWKEHLCVFGASKGDISHVGTIPVIWIETDGPFVFGNDGSTNK